jgi:lipopolysaccharide transport system permease protein
MSSSTISEKKPLSPKNELEGSKIQQSVIRSSHGWNSLGLRDLWEYRELLVYLVWREVQGAYRQTALGISWLFLRPIINMLVLTLVFGELVRVSSDDVPYPLFSLAALLPWGFFSNAVIRSSRSLVDNMNVISKVYFPRMVIPISSSLSGLLDFGASLIVFFGVLLVYKYPLRIEMIMITLLLFISLSFSLAVGLWLATLSVKFRDVSFAVNFLIQALMYASPVIYSASIVPESMRFLYNLNPMTGVIQGFRWALLGSGQPLDLSFGYSIILVVILLISGAYVFRRTERTVVDIL